MNETALRSHTLPIQELEESFGERLALGAPLARYTAARVGGAADVLLHVNSVEQLVAAAGRLWALNLHFVMLGGGSNVLVSDAGVRGVVVLNRARRVRFIEKAGAHSVWAESGANLGVVARQAAARGWAGLEWAAGIPGTVGGAVVGNAGAHGGDMAGSLILAEILHREGVEAAQVVRERWPVERLGYGYRTSLLKRSLDARPGETSSRVPRTVVLAAQLRLERSSVEAVQAKSDEFTAYRHRTQPPGASMGSMFKNPPGDYAGRLIQAAGLKGTRIGRAEISPLHANFFINHGGASSADIRKLIELARQAVFEKFDVKLELEIELIGEWEQEGSE